MDASELLLLQRRSSVPWSCPGPWYAPRQTPANRGCPLQSWLLLSSMSDPIPGAHAGLRGSCSLMLSESSSTSEARPDPATSWAMSYQAAAERRLCLPLQPYMLQPRKAGDEDENAPTTRVCTSCKTQDLFFVICSKISHNLCWEPLPSLVTGDRPFLSH